MSSLISISNSESMGFPTSINLEIGGPMYPQIIFLLQLVFGYVACLLCFGAYVFPKLKSMDRMDAQRLIATVHSFRFFGLVFILPGIVGSNLPAGFATFSAYWDLATGILAMLALLTFRIRPLFWLFVLGFNLVGTIDLVVDYYHAIQFGLPALAGQLGATYGIPILYVPALMITHITAFYFLIRPQREVARSVSRHVVPSYD
jgi:hypothetical protein